VVNHSSSGGSWNTSLEGICRSTATDQPRRLTALLLHRRDPRRCRPLAPELGQVVRQRRGFSRRHPGGFRHGHASGPTAISARTRTALRERLHNPRSLATSNARIVLQRGGTMRAEIETVVDEIKQSLGLLRRHL
jgi:hypothetical protein